MNHWKRYSRLRDIVIATGLQLGIELGCFVGAFVHANYALAAVFGGLSLLCLYSMESARRRLSKVESTG